MKVRFTRRAVREARDARDWLKVRQPKTVDGFTVRFRECIARLREFPNAGSPERHSSRRLTLKPYPYAIIYRVSGDEVTIVAVAHAKKRPGYWAGR